MLKIIDVVVEKLGGALSGLSLVIMLIVGYDAIARYAFNSPTIWAWAVSKQLFGAMVLFAGAYSMLHDRHIRVEVFYERFGPRMKRVCWLITTICVVFFLGVVIWKGYSMAETSIGQKEILSQAFAMPYYPLKILVPIAALLFLLQSIAKLLRK